MTVLQGVKSEAVELTTTSMGSIFEEFKAFYRIKEMPFSLLPNTQYYVALPSSQQCLSMLIFALNIGEGILKVTGEVGTGKTLVCRRLLNALDETVFYSAYIPNPNLSAIELKRAVAKEIQVQDLSWVTDDDLMDVINKRLIELAKNNKKVVLVIDEAQALSESSIEALRLLTNLETETQKLLQVVLFAQPELDKLLDQHATRQICQRITYSHYLEPLALNQVDQYVLHRLAMAGYQGPAIFDSGALRALHRYSKGVPRLISIICGKALLISFSKGVHNVNKVMVKQAAMDTEGVSKGLKWLFKYK